MKIWGLDDAQLRYAMHQTMEKYANNVDFKRYPEKDGRAFRCTLKVHTSYLAGSRRTFNMDGSVRRVAASCWHVHRDFMIECFYINSDARIQTMHADYRGFGSFLEQFPATGLDNIGSQAQPLEHRQACNCPGGIGYEKNLILGEVGNS